jgi:hypothetical protein
MAHTWAVVYVVSPWAGLSYEKEGISQKFGLGVADIFGLQGLIILNFCE